MQGTLLISLICALLGIVIARAATRRNASLRCVMIVSRIYRRTDLCIEHSCWIAHVGYDAWHWRLLRRDPDTAPSLTCLVYQPGRIQDDR